MVRKTVALSLSCEVGKLFRTRNVSGVALMPSVEGPGPDTTKNNKKRICADLCLRHQCQSGTSIQEDRKLFSGGSFVK